MAELWCGWFGQTPYEIALQWQQILLNKRAKRLIPDVLLALEHPPTYTVGSGTKPEHLPSAEYLAQNGAAFYHTRRGGSITYHGPGQLIGYPIIHLSAVDYDVHRYLRLLEEACIRVLSKWNIPAQREAPYTGVWVKGAKIASIGVRVSRQVAMHGLALNVNPDLGAFDRITPCGLEGKRMTSMADFGVDPPPLSEVAQELSYQLAKLLEHQVRDDVGVLAQICTLGEEGK
jgi:lipoate-protein ligase B